MIALEECEKRTFQPEDAIEGTAFEQGSEIVTF
jgi:hypothetical protein